MNKNLLILFCLFSLMQVSRAQDPIFGEPQHSTLSADSLSDVVGLIPESLDANVDSLLHSWHVQYFSKVDEYCHDDAENVYFPDSVYEERLERLPSVIRLPYNEVVRDCIDLYAGRKRDLVRYMLGMADFYFPIIETNWPEWMPFIGGNHFIFFSPIFNFADAAISCGIIALLLFYSKYLNDSYHVIKKS